MKKRKAGKGSKKREASQQQQQQEQAEQEQEQDLAVGDEAALMELYGRLVEFYTRHKPENLDEDVLTILIQFVIDTGGKASLNKKLKAQYGEDLESFDALGQAQTTGTSLELQQPESPKMRKPRPPSQPKEDTMKNIRKSLKTKRVPGDLDVLDHPTKSLEARDLLEAFYSMHDESKLTSDTGVEKFVIWAEKNGIDALDTKLQAKYDKSLKDDEVKRIALRRRNLEDKITAFYMKYDAAKLNTRFTVLNIVNWTMKHGLTELNEKFMERYGRVVVDLSGLDDVDIELDI